MEVVKLCLLEGPGIGWYSDWPSPCGLGSVDVGWWLLWCGEGTLAARPGLLHGPGVRSARLPDEILCYDTLVIPGLVHASVVLPSTNGGLETSLAPWKFVLKGAIVQRRLSSRGSCWSRLACGSSAVVIRGLVIESRASFQDGRRGWQLRRPVSPSSSSC